MIKKKTMITTISVTLAAAACAGGIYAVNRGALTEASSEGQAILTEAAGDPAADEADLSSDETNTDGTDLSSYETTSVKAKKSSSAGGAISKEETVYVSAGADGSVQEISVSDWLRNSGNAAGTVVDKTDLKDIENVKGNETFSQEGQQLLWDADDADICYQGSSNRSLPVDMEIRYFLNDVEMTPEQLAGRDGHLKMEVSFKNRAQVTKTVSGKKETMYSPFVMVTGMILPEEHFSNVTVDNGKCVNDGSRNFVFGYSMPGLKESLNLPDEASDILPVSDGFTMEADVTDCELSGTYTAALTDVLSDLDFDGIADTDELKEKLDQLDTAAEKLVKGSKELADGTGELKEKYKTFSDGVDQLAAGISQLDSGSQTLRNGLRTYTDGTDTLADGITQYTAGVSTVENGVNQYTKGVDTLSSGLKEYAGGVKTLQSGVLAYTTGADKLGKGVKQYTEGADQLGDGIVKYTEGADTLVDGLKEYTGGVDKLADGITAYTDGVRTYSNGADQYIGGVNKLGSGVKEYTAGVRTLGEGIRDYTSSVGLLDEKMGEFKNGTDDLADGLSTYLDGAGSLTEGVRKYVSGAVQVTDGTKEYVAGADKLAGGITEYLDGETALTDGIGQLVPGIESAVDGIDQAVTALSAISEKVQDLNLTDEKAEALKKHLAGTKELIQGVQKYVGVVQSVLEKIAALEQDGGQVPDGVQALIDRFSGLKDRLLSITDTLNAVSTALAGANEQLVRTKDDVTGTMSNVASQLRAIAEAAENGNGAAAGLYSMDAFGDAYDAGSVSDGNEAAVPDGFSDDGEAQDLFYADEPAETDAADTLIDADETDAADTLIDADETDGSDALADTGETADAADPEDLNTGIEDTDMMFDDGEAGAVIEADEAEAADLTGGADEESTGGDLIDAGSDDDGAAAEVPSDGDLSVDDLSVGDLSMGDLSMGDLSVGDLGMDDLAMDDLNQGLDPDAASEDSYDDAADAASEDPAEMPELVETVYTEPMKAAPALPDTLYGGSMDPELIQELYALADALDAASNRTDGTLSSLSDRLTDASGKVSNMASAIKETGIEDDLSDLMNDLNESSLSDIREMLAGGTDQLLETCGTIQETLEGADGLIDLLSGMDLSGIEGMQRDFEALKEGAARLKQGNEQLQAAYRSGALSDAQKQLRDGAAKLKSSGAQLVQGIDTLQGADHANADALTDGADQLDEGSRTLSEGSGKIKSAADQLAKGVSELAGHNSTITEGVDKLTSSGKELDSGVKTLLDSSSKLTEGGKTLRDSSDTLTSGASEIKKGSTKLNAGADKLKGSSETLSGGAEKLAANSKTLTDGADQLTQSSSQLNSGVKTLKSGANKLVKGANKLTKNSSKLNKGLARLTGNNGTLTSGAARLKSAGAQLNSGAETLANGIGKVNNGAETLSKASGQVSEGIEKLDNGAKTLSEGEKKFYDEGISKIQKELDEKLGDTLDRLKLLQSDDVTYDSYSGKADDMESHVKFIIETEGVEKASA